MELSEIRKQYVETEKQLKVLHDQQKQFLGRIMYILDNEPSEAKRKKIIDKVYKGKVEEVHEYFLRKTYLNN